MQIKLTATLAFFAGMLLFTTGLFAQNSKKASISEHRLLTGLTLEQLQTQSYSHMAKEYSLEDFMVYYVEHGQEKVTKQYGSETFRTVYSDSAYTYLVRRTESYNIAFLKVLKEDLADPYILETDGQALRQKFLSEIVPEADKQKVAKATCSMGYQGGGFSYTYNRQTKQLGITYKWKVSCDLIRVLNKTYQAKYNIETKVFEK